MLTGAVVATVAGLFPIQALAEMVNIGTLFAFVIVCIAVWIMRYTNPDQRRPFRCPFVPVIPALGIVFNVGLMFSLGWHNWARLGVWLAVGLIIYFTYSRHHSRLAHVAPVHAVSALSAVMMTGVAIVGLLYRPKARLVRTVGWAGLFLFSLYLLNSYILFLYAE